jgi:hypothetical protein
MGEANGAMRPAGALAMILGLAGVCGARAGTIDVAPQALVRYAWCLEQARSEDRVWPGERGIAYRCLDATAAGYYNELGRRGRHPRDRLARTASGAFVLRPISGLGNCWHQVEDEIGRPVSAWGCDVFVAY